MSAFIDPEATELVVLDACYCPDSPHDHDTVTIRAQYGYGDVLALASVHTSGNRFDPMAERAKLLELGIKSWTFTDAKGPVPVNMATILLLSMDVSASIAAAIDAAYGRSQTTLPNASSGRSQPSSPASSTASANRATRRRAKR